MAAEKLKKSLTLFDVFAISTGAMFSSGFFLLPGLAAAETGPSVVLAYLLAGVLVLPAMFSQAELCTAMPKAGGTYYFLDRSLGPMAGTVGGLGTWLALVFKSAFALIGMGAYLAIFVEVPIKPLAVALTVAFSLLNIVGAKETSGLQRIFVVTLLSVLAFFVAQGLFEVFSVGMGTIHSEQFTPFVPFGLEGILSTIGLVFVSYAGLTKVASVAEEVQNPDRNIPLGMMLSLFTATFVYVVGVYIMVAVLDPQQLRTDLTPVATAGEAFFDWLPEPFGLYLIVIAAIAAFASTGNAGILSASRYPLAMARDHLIDERLARLGRFGTPTAGVLLTGALMIFFIVALDAEGVAKLASAFNLLIFGLLNLAVIVMRESGISSYVPGYRSPWYPWMQIVGIFSALFLIAEMGLLSIAFTIGMIAACVGWYYYYVHGNDEVVREGAIYHLFARLGEYRYEPLDSELRAILKEKGLPDEAPFEQLVTRAAILDVSEDVLFEEVVERASATLADRLGLSADQLEHDFMSGSRYGATPVAHGAALPHQRLSGIRRAELVMVRCRSGVCIQFGEDVDLPDTSEPVYAIFFLVSPEEHPGQHLRVLANIASRIDESSFMQEWRSATGEQQLKETLLRHDRYLSLHLAEDLPTSSMIGKSVRDLQLPPGNLIALVRHGQHAEVPDGNTVLRAGDDLTVIGDAAGIRQLAEQYTVRQPQTEA